MNDKELVHWLEKAVSGEEPAFQLFYQATNQDVYRTVSFLVYRRIKPCCIQNCSMSWGGNSNEKKGCMRAL
ncbi:hypothetical protein [Cohnella sp. GCM10012308]|uniref:hypothetical protein n=1 Tax=Cohnella sp. GCM10012308 TaxID=3317329 RepID=UPI003607670A